MQTVYLFIAILASTLLGIQADKGRSRQPDWEKMSDWKLYRENTFKRVFSVPIDSLPNIPSGTLSLDSMRSFLATAEKIEGVNPQWQGCYLVSCRDTTGTIHKVVVSHYGGFFYSPEEHAYYQVPGTSSRDWLIFFSNNYMRLFAGKTP